MVPITIVFMGFINHLVPINHPFSPHFPTIFPIISPPFPRHPRHSELLKQPLCLRGAARVQALPQAAEFQDLAHDLSAPGYTSDCSWFIVVLYIYILHVVLYIIVVVIIVIIIIIVILIYNYIHTYMVFYGEVCIYNTHATTGHGTPDLLLPLQDGRERDALLSRGTKRGAKGDLSDFVLP